jgi:hypothetical protein
MGNTDKQVEFQLIGIKTEKFAYFDKVEIDSSNVEIQTQIRFNLTPSEHQLDVYVFFTFKSNDEIFIAIEVGCKFLIKEENWNLFHLADSKSIVFPKEFIRHLLVLTFGTTRGVLHAKTEGSDLNRYFLPTMNVEELITEDVVLNFELIRE